MDEPPAGPSCWVCRTCRTALRSERVDARIAAYRALPPASRDDLLRILHCTGTDVVDGETHQFWDWMCADVAGALAEVLGPDSGLMVWNNVILDEDGELWDVSPDFSTSTRDRDVAEPVEVLIAVGDVRYNSVPRSSFSRHATPDPTVIELGSFHSLPAAVERKREALVIAENGRRARQDEEARLEQERIGNLQTQIGCLVVTMIAVAVAVLVWLVL